MGSIVAYRNDNRPFAELVLDGGIHVTITLNTAGAVIRQISGARQAGDVLFHASPELVARICTSLEGGARSTPLDILVNATIGLGSVTKIKSAFRNIAAEASP
jgi:hypothetical protein